MQTTIENRLIVYVEIIIELEGHCKYLIYQSSKHCLLWSNLFYQVHYLHVFVACVFECFFMTEFIVVQTWYYFMGPSRK